MGPPGERFNSTPGTYLNNTLGFAYFSDCFRVFQGETFLTPADGQRYPKPCRQKANLWMCYKARKPGGVKEAKNTLVLFKAQLREPFLEVFDFLLSFFHHFRQSPALKWAKPALKRPNRHLKNMAKASFSAYLLGKFLL